MMQEQRIGFIGTGVMGAPMAGHLQKAGYKVHVYNRTRSKAEALIENGAEWAEPKDLASQCDIIFTMLGDPGDVDQIYFGDQGIIESSKAGTIFCDFTTSSPALAERIQELCLSQNKESLDAPVSGGDIGAQKALLSIMCGGERKTFDALMPLLELMGKNIVYQGPAGSGQHTKMCNQITIASAMMGICEAMVYAKKSGLEAQNVLKSIQSGAAGSWALSNLAPRILEADFEPGFYVEHFIKDMDIAINESDRLGVAVPGLKAARNLYDQVREMGLGRKGTQALFLAYEAMN